MKRWLGLISGMGKVSNWRHCALLSSAISNKFLLTVVCEELDWVLFYPVSSSTSKRTIETSSVCGKKIVVGAPDMPSGAVGLVDRLQVTMSSPAVAAQKRHRESALLRYREKRSKVSSLRFNSLFASASAVVPANHDSTVSDVSVPCSESLYFAINCMDSGSTETSRGVSRPRTAPNDGRHFLERVPAVACTLRVQDDHRTRNRSNSSMHETHSPARTKRIFVGGLLSTITKSDVKKYSSQFETIIDVVVMYTHNTQRPGGFGFIMYDSEAPVDRVLVRTFRELNGKMVEVKRDVPKELSPRLARSPSSYSPNRAGGFFNCYCPGYNSLNAVGGCGMRMNARFNTIGRVRVSIVQPWKL